MNVTVAEAFQIALQHHQAGRLAEAEGIYRQILAQDPNHAGALHYLGVAAHQTGRDDVAVEMILKAIAVAPTVAEFHSNLGAAYRKLGRLAEAVAACRRAIELKPDYPEAHSNLGGLLRDTGHLAEAIASCRRAVELRPGYAEACNNLGNALTDRGDLAEAVQAYHRAIQSKPEYAAACNNLGNALRKQGRFDEAIGTYRRALQLQPGLPDALNNLGNVFKDQGRLDDALDAYRSALARKPHFPEAHSNLIYALHFHPAHDDRTIAGEHARWNRQFADPVKQFLLPHANNRDPGRRLRIGYVSPDFRGQAEVFFVLPLLEAHDHRQFEIHCYASVRRPDHLTDRLRSCADVWHDVYGRPDEEVAARIREDGIDILVDLTMHMEDSRLLVFARKPAPVQVTWLAYPGSTGLETMDYRITDAHIDPPGGDTSHYSEESVRLPDCWVCYHPLAEEPAVGPLPAGDAGAVTFGCLNNFCKVNGPVLALWADVLGAVDGSRLMLLAPEGGTRGRVLEEFARHGIGSGRIEFIRTLPRREYLRLYHSIDIALDTLPYNGITTTCDALWMGVPVVSLAGKTAAGRVGAGILAAAGLPELATRSAEDFVRAAADLASDRPRMVRVRGELRERMQASALMDAPRFARNMEDAYRKMWRAWCAEPSSRL